jgi:acetyltransferase-like isoleucine patch superfamily enzyme
MFPAGCNVEFKCDQKDLINLNVICDKRFKCENNTIIIGEHLKISNSLKITFRGSGNKITIGNNNFFQGLNIDTWRDNNVLTLGDNITFGEGNYIALGGGVFDNHNLSVNIQDDCMFSHNTTIFNTDGHPIINPNDGNQVNIPTKGIDIGEHVWIGLKSTILKGVSIGACSIVGANTTVTKNVGFNQTCVGENRILPLNGKLWIRGEARKADAMYYLYKHNNKLTEYINENINENENILFLKHKDILSDAVHHIKSIDFNSADFWREIGIFSYSSGNKELGILAMKQAKKLRPNGPYINQLIDMWS